MSTSPNLASPRPPHQLSSSTSSVIAPGDRPEDHHDVESLHAYLSAFLDQTM
jgi:hypothetical protein